MIFSRFVCQGLLAFVIASGAHAESSSAISGRTTVNTLDLHPLTTIPSSTRETKTPDGRSLVLRSSPRLAIDRTGKKQLYFKMVVPEFSQPDAGWPGKKRGMGAFYGLEPVYSGPSTDSLHYKIGGSPPSTTTPESEWKPMLSNSVLNRSVTPGIWYFRVALGSATKDSSSLLIRYHSARFVGVDGSPITSLDATKNHWFLIHGKNSGESSLRDLNNAFRKGTSASRIITIDWASGAESSPAWNKPAANGQYFQPLGKSLAELFAGLGLKGSRTSILGHSWGAVVGYETGRRVGNLANLVTLDPTAKAPGDYDIGSINFSAVSRISTGIKSGNKIEGSLGDESLTSTCDFTIRLFSENHTGDVANPAFHHQLPLDWCAKAMADDTDPYSAFFKNSILLRNTPGATMPWGEYQPVVGFDLECHGSTSYTNAPGTGTDQVSFNATRFLVFSKPSGKLTKARTSGPVSKPNWSYSAY